MNRYEFYAKYFGKNTARIFYCIGVGLALFGVVNCIVGNAFWGFFACVIGVALFFITSHKQVSDKHIDDLVAETVTAYKEEKIKGVSFFREEVDPDKFSLFYGFIRDNGEVRFKAGRDGKIRTSRFYVTAISAERDDCKVFTSVYDILSGEVKDAKLCTKNASDVRFEKQEIEFPRGNYFCNITQSINERAEEINFYIPADALADKLTSMIGQ